MSDAVIHYGEPMKLSRLFELQNLAMKHGELCLALRYLDEVQVTVNLSRPGEQLARDDSIHRHQWRGEYSGGDVTKWLRPYVRELLEAEKVGLEDRMRMMGVEVDGPPQPVRQNF